MSNINDLVKLTGYAKSTVSNVFTKRRFVSAEIVDKVMTAAEQIKYTPNFFASNILSNDSNIIGLFLETDNDAYYPFYNELIQSVVTNGNKIYKQVLIYFNLKEAEIPKLLKSGCSPLCGAIILSPGFIDKRISGLDSVNLPYVVIGKPNDDRYAALTVDIDNAKLVKMVINHLYSRGNKDIFFINSVKNLTVTKDRDEGAKQKCTEYRDMRLETVYLKNKEGEAKTPVQKALKEGKRSFICASDFHANDVYEQAREDGFTVGKDVSVISLGGNLYADSLRPRMTHAYQSFERVGAESVQLLGRRLADKDYSERKILSSVLKLGESVVDFTAEQAPAADVGAG